MDDPAFMLLQLQENLHFLRTQSGAHVLSCVTHNQAGKPYWTYVVLTYDNHGNVQEYHEPFEGRAEWTNQPLQALRQLHLRVAGLVTNRLTRGSQPRLRTLAEQRHDGAVENSIPDTGNNFNGIHHGSQPMASSSTSRPSSEHLKSQISAPPSYQTQEMNPSRLHRTCHLSDRDTLDSIDRVSSTRLRRMQAFENGRTVQPLNSGSAQYPQAPPALSTGQWSSGGTSSRVISTASSNHGFGTDGPSLQQQTSATAQRDRLRFAQTQRRPTGLRIPPSILEKTASDSQISPINVSSASSYQTEQFRVDADLPENRVQAPVQSSRSQLSRSVNATDIRQGLIGMRALRISPDANDEVLQQRSNTNTLPQPLPSHPPYPGDPILIAISPETWALRQTNPEEFRRRLDTNPRAQEELRTRDPIAYIEYEAAEILNRDSEPGIDDQTLDSLATRIRDYGIRSPGSTLSGSPASDETVTPGYPPYRRRRMTQTRCINKETGDPLPPAAPSPPLNSHYPSSLPVYPPTLANSRSEASTQRQTSNNRSTDSATRASLTNQISSSNKSMRNTAPFGGSVTSLLRLGPFDQHNSEDEYLLRQEGGPSRRLSQNHEENRGEQVRPLHLFHYSTSFAVKKNKNNKNCELMIK
jgi:hypothetical protein